MSTPPPKSKTPSAERGARQLERARQGTVEGFQLVRVRKFRAFSAIVAVVVISFAIGLFAGVNLGDVPIAPLPAPPSMSQCMTDTVATLRPNQTPSTDLLGQARDHCYSLIHSHGLLKDFATRELNFIQQYRANGVLMWMVVTVTLSGVVLAGLQLMASYELARTNRRSPVGDSKFSFKRDRVVLKSSITGLFILVMSFAFFLVFVFYVYRFEHVDNQIIHIPTQTPILPMGGLGPPEPSK